MEETIPVPSEDECFAIMKRYNMRDNIMRHSVQVMNVAMTLVANLRDPGAVQPGLVRAGALLHDIAKTRTIETKEMRHDMIGGEIMRGLGYGAIAEIVESHVVFEGFRPDGVLEARELVFYADKRVMHESIVSIDARVDDLVERYGVNERIVKLITENKDFVLEVERKIQGFLVRDIGEIVAGLC